MNVSEDGHEDDQRTGVVLIGFGEPEGWEEAEVEAGNRCSPVHRGPRVAVPSSVCLCRNRVRMVYKRAVNE